MSSVETPTVVSLVRTASRSLGRLLDQDPNALVVLDDLGRRPPVDDSGERELARWKQYELLRIAARDLAGIDGLEAVGYNLAALAADVFAAACRLAGAQCLAIIGMGKLGGSELNYASDVDVMLVGDGDPVLLDRQGRAVVELARRCFRVDLNLRPEGRQGALVRSVASYQAYWQRWAEPWEFQALLKARPVAGDTELGAAFDAAAREALWSRPVTADALRQMRTLKARAEAEVARKGVDTRELKRGRGGIRDVEFAVQLLQLVHGGADPALRTPTTLLALEELAAAGYVAAEDATALADAYRFLRTTEHRLQLRDEHQVHTLPDDEAELDVLARTMGYVSDSAGTAVERFTDDLRTHQATVRAIHERLWFRPLLEAFARDGDRTLTEEAATTRLAAFGFTDAARTRQAVQELTRGLNRSSRLMQQMLPLLFEWLSVTPDPDLGLLSLRKLASGPHRTTELATAFRESPEIARRLCRLLGTSPWIGELLRRNPDIIGDLAAPDEGLTLRPRDDLLKAAHAVVDWREHPTDKRSALKRFTDREGLRIGASDVLDLAGPAAVGTSLAELAEVALEVALAAGGPTVPFAIVAAGRLGGGELSYASDLDLLFVYDGSSNDDFEAAEHAAESVLRFLGGSVPHTYDIDTSLRPEGRGGPLARSLDGYARYAERWAQPWERMALTRARPVAGDLEVGRRLLGVLEPFLWGPLRPQERREIRRIKARVERERIPPGEDPAFHLKLGRGTLSDVEFCTQLLQLEEGIREPSTIRALARLADCRALTREEHDVLRASYDFCEQARNRLFLLRGAPADALPSTLEELERLATSLGTSARALREQYRRVTRRARAVFEHRFYGAAPGAAPKS